MTAPQPDRAAAAEAVDPDGAHGPANQTERDASSDTPAVAMLDTAQLLTPAALFDATAPTVAFLTAFAVTGQALQPALIAALVVALGSAVVRLRAGAGLRTVLVGVAGVAISAWFAARSHSAAGFFLPGMLVNAAYGTAYLVSALVGWPFIGVLVGLAEGTVGGTWRTDRALYRACRAATLMFAGLFALRLAVTVPLYLAGATGPLGIAKLVLGTPAFLLVAWLSWGLIGPARARAMAVPVPVDAEDQPRD